MGTFDPITFGIGMGQLVAEYRNAYSWIAPLPHIAILVILTLVFRHGQRMHKVFTLYFVINYTWLVIFQGGWFSYQVYQRMGLAGLAVYAATPILLIWILYQWIHELIRPRLDLNFRTISTWRLCISAPMFLWAFWYPPYEWGVGLAFDLKHLLFGAYGLMGCPSTMVPLSLLFLKYPQGNRPLFYSLTVYALCIGTAMVALQYVPDIPFFLLGIAALCLIIGVRIGETRTN